ncbi:transcription termination/antitermination protein NusG [Rhizobium oryzicola]|uniref:Transcription termination/antitermination NusG family protein n=1 Tax=Rhizobium oryzicola TaxID=1232668 RepID=A0ABT8SVP1_9HYPH|nr:transcription termination/antitermination NusG family protein [Rhizobium oryzicola]MDO1582416.1 transcription termination/antitermination NusG family protein [Rhizobium oryzicola]
MMQHKALMGFPIGIARKGESMRGVLLERLEACAGPCVKRWFAARVMTGRELAVENQLVSLGIDALVPMRKGPDLRRRGRIIPGVLMPVIHGYVLVHMPPEGAELVALQAIDHFISIVGGYENPMPITDNEVKRFKALADDGAYDWERPTGKVLRSGDRAKLYDGPFVGMAGEVISCRSDGRGDVVVLIDMLGGKVPVTVPLAICEKL